MNDSVGKTTGIRHLKSQYSHANFWAMPKNGNSATIFFAEFSNDEDCKNLQSFCHPVSDLSRHGMVLSPNDMHLHEVNVSLK